MAVYTSVSQREMTEFLSNYDIGMLESYQGIEQGVSNTNFFVTTHKGRFVLTLFEPHRVKEKEIPFFMNYAMTLEKAGVPCPRGIPDRDGKILSRLCSRPAAFFSILEGEGGSPSMLTPALCEKAGAVLAKMHVAAEGIKDVSTNHYSLSCWRRWVATLDRKIDFVAKGLYDFVSKELNWIEDRWPKLPPGTIHADFFPDNVFFKNNEITGVIDFHFVCTDSFAYDLAIALNAWSFDDRNEFRKDRMDAFLKGYNSVRKLSQEEKDALPVMLRGAALRFLLSRIEEKLNWNPDSFMKPHDPMVFEKRLKHFQRMGA